MNPKKYNNIKLSLGILKAVLTFMFILAFVYYDYSKLFVDYLSGYSSNAYLILLAFSLILSVVSSLVFFPISFYSEFLLEHKYNLSNQTFLAWIWENLKASLVGAIIGLPLLTLFYYTLNIFGNLWWLPFAIILFFVTVILSKVLPIIILPIFYKITPIENEELKRRIIKLSENVDMRIENVFQFNMSKNTKKANAAFTGFGKTKKILLGDTLIEEFSNDEIETVIAHELGHYKHKHIIVNIIISTISSFLTFFLLSVLYSYSLNLFGFEKITDIGALPILLLWGMLIGIITTPLTSYLSRKHEYQADEYAVKTTKKKDIFINSLIKLTDKNLGDKEPHPIIEWFFYSHPSIKNRIVHINSVSIKQ